MQVNLRRGYDAGSAIRQRRRMHGLTQEELAQKAGVGVQTVIRLEKATAKVPADALVTTLQAIGRVLNMTFVVEPGGGGNG